MASRLFVEIGAKTSGFQKALSKIERNVNRFSRKMQNLGTNLTQAISLPLVGLGAGAIRAAGNIEALEKGLEAVLPAGRNAADELDRLRKIAELPGLGFEQAVRGSVQLQAIGFNADQAAMSLEAFGKVVAITGGTADQLDSVVRQITQLNAKGRILQEDLSIIQENAPAVGIALQDAFGTTNIEAIRASGVSAGEFTKRLVEAINQSETFAKVQGGLKNSIANVGIAFQAFLSDIGKEINRLFDVQGIAERLSTTLSNLAKRFRGLSDAQKRGIVVIAGVATAIGPVLLIVGKLVSIVPVLTTGLSALAGVFAFLVSPIGLAIVGITALVAGFIYLYNRFESVRQVTAGVIEVFKKLGNTAKVIFQAIVKAFKGDFAGARESLQSGFNFGSAFVAGVAKGADELDVQSVKDKILGAVSGDPFSAARQSFGKLAISGAQSPGGGKGGSTGPERTVSPLSSLDPSADFEGIEIATKRIESISGATASWAARTKELIDPVIVMNEQMTTQGVIAENLADSWARFSEVMGGTLSEALQSAGSAMVELANQGETSFRKLGQAALKSAAQVVRAKLIEAVSSYLASAFTKFGIFGLPLAAAGGAIVGALFNNVIKGLKIPALAQGGLAFGPSLAVVGDNQGARSNPEVIAPLDKLKAMMGGNNVHVTGEFRIKGTDLVLTLEKAQQEVNRLR